jgi:hypothetical protein
VRRAARQGRLNPAAVKKLTKILDEAIAEVEKVFDEDRSR